MLLRMYAKVLILLILRAAKGQGLSMLAARNFSLCPVYYARLHHALPKHLCGHAHTGVMPTASPHSLSHWHHNDSGRNEKTQLSPKLWGYRPV